MSNQALEYLIGKAEKLRDSAGVELARSRNTEQQISDQIEMLTQYRQEYRRRLNQALLKGTPLHTVRDIQSFLVSLDQAIDNAYAYHEKQQRQTEDSFAEMSRCQRELSSFNTLVQRRQAAHARELDRRERKEQDALATRIHQRKNTDG
ncbi:flagellar export protein FliJ [Mangrovimicrobium sediminis]|uniref:Flagellar FliJ protein n=1 Tax=Mangrovimicrobium sediminis TaxID=2562682 RepID=A0A4Z0M0U9_9GAMM|nr:flagellar export protein FliJ [Haliea sp. SAOS-164]TGD73149.1 flagellar export protein FliJ [Haliea sp. SAOS-164]